MTWTVSGGSSWQKLLPMVCTERANKAKDSLSRPFRQKGRGGGGHRDLRISGQVHSGSRALRSLQQQSPLGNSETTAL